MRELRDSDAAGGLLQLVLKLLPSSRALAIAKRSCAGRKADEPLFRVVDARKSLSWINEEAGTDVQGHGLRATFASLAEELVSSARLAKR